MRSVVLKKIETFFSQYPRRIYPGGQILFFANEDPNEIIYLVAGKVCQYAISYRGDELITNIFKPPAFFPMSWAVAKLPNQFFYKTELETIAYVAPPEDVLEFLTSNPDVTLDILGQLYMSIEGVLGRVVHLMSGTAKNRLMYELMVECRSFGINQDHGKFLITISGKELAARSGLSRETISRKMKYLKDKNVLAIDTRGVLIIDVNALGDMLADEI